MKLLCMLAIAVVPAVSSADSILTYIPGSGDLLLEELYNPPVHVSTENPLVVTYDVQAQATQAGFLVLDITNVTFNLSLRDDLFDPGESLTVTPPPQSGCPSFDVVNLSSNGHGTGIGSGGALADYQPCWPNLKSAILNGPVTFDVTVPQGTTFGVDNALLAMTAVVLTPEPKSFGLTITALGFLFVTAVKRAKS